mmetsp:Transcript_12758/g.33852  ORF Transcript_12758/g.33852 Transcript_12758/m.33852 type:complete len:310 (-) Transcript_12758:238-1167(-)
MRQILFTSRTCMRPPLLLLLFPIAFPCGICASTDNATLTAVVLIGAAAAADILEYTSSRLSSCVRRLRLQGLPLLLFPLRTSNCKHLAVFSLLAAQGCSAASAPESVLLLQHSSKASAVPALHQYAHQPTQAVHTQRHHHRGCQGVAGRHVADGGRNYLEAQLQPGGPRMDQAYGVKQQHSQAAEGRQWHLRLGARRGKELGLEVQGHDAEANASISKGADQHQDRGSYSHASRGPPPCRQQHRASQHEQGAEQADLRVHGNGRPDERCCVGTEQEQAPDDGGVPVRCLPPCAEAARFPWHYLLLGRCG